MDRLEPLCVAAKGLKGLPELVGSLSGLRPSQHNLGFGFSLVVEVDLHLCG